MRQDSDKMWEEIAAHKKYFESQGHIVGCIFCQQQTELQWQGVYNHIPVYWCKDCCGIEDSFVEHHLVMENLPEAVIHYVSFYHFRNIPDRDIKKPYRVVYTKNRMFVCNGLQPNAKLIQVTLDTPFQITISPANAAEKFNNLLAFL